MSDLPDEADEDELGKPDLDWLHSLMQELENAGVELPMGDYMTVYDIIERARDE